MESVPWRNDPLCYFVAKLLSLPASAITCCSYGFQIQPFLRLYYALHCGFIFVNVFLCVCFNVKLRDSGHGQSCEIQDQVMQMQSAGKYV